MGSHDSFRHFKHKLWPKEGPKIKLVIWLPTTKSQESPWFPCVKVACDLSLESCQQGLQLCFRPHCNRRFAHKVMGPQRHGSPNFGNLPNPKPNFGSSETKWHLGASPMARHKVYYKGEGDDFFEIQVVVSLVSSCFPVVHPNTKNIQTMH